MDWGLISCTRDKRVFKRQRMLFPWPIYFIIVSINFVLRFSWLINRFPAFQNLHSSVIVLIIELGEIFRRAMWFIFRIEWEILVNIERGSLSLKDATDYDEASISLLKVTADDNDTTNSGRRVSHSAAGAAGSPNAPPYMS